MAKVFLSFLGTSDYVECIYYHGAQDVKNARFVQEATLQLFCRKWTAEDRILIFTTEEAFKKNWLDNGHEDFKTKSRIRCDGLESCINRLELKAQVQRVPIGEGKSEAEIWDIFGTVFDCLKEGDEVIFDITHAFRSIPMLAIVILSYAKVMKDVKLIGIYYGAFEVIGTPSVAKGKPLEERRAPVLSLTSFNQLMEWSLAVDRFLGAGDAVPLSRLAETSAKPFLAASKGRDLAADTIRKIAQRLEEFSRILSTCRGPEITSASAGLREIINKYESFDLVQPFKPIVSRIRDQLMVFQGDSVIDGIKAAQWCMDHNLIQQGFTILQETLITHFVRVMGENEVDNFQRDIASQAAKIVQDNVPREKWFSPASENIEMVEKYRDFFRNRAWLVELYRNLSNLRNDMNHAGYKENPCSSKTFEKRLKEFIATIEMHVSESSM